MIKNIIKEHPGIIIFLIIYFLIISSQIISHPTPFYDWDEAIYAQVGREMVSNKSLVPLWQDNYWLDKPPLTPLFYGLIGLIPVNPEISLRLVTLGLSIVAMIFIYTLYLKVSNNKFISFGSVILTSITPVFYQRAQVLNVDIFLLIGWLGYLLFFRRFWWSLVFLFIGVMSKSLLGFYPVLGILFYYFFKIFLLSRDKNIVLNPEWKKLLKNYLKITKPYILQICLVVIWYIGMIIFFKYSFIEAHFFDSHLKRVTASIESHFGTRTFYFESVYQQFGLLSWLSILSIILLFRRYFNKINIGKFFISLFFIPWFLFLNLTKTKIAWYLYPVIPQMSFLLTYVSSLNIKSLLLKNNAPNFIKSQKGLYNHLGNLILIIILAVFIHRQIIVQKLFTNRYSGYDDTYKIAQSAKKYCSQVNVLVDNQSRRANSTLKKMNLLIKTSQWWGNHPSIVYYSERKTKFIYNINELSRIKKPQCLIINNDDLKIINKSNFKIITKNNSFMLLK